MKTINELQNEVIEEFSDFDDWMDKYQLLIDLGNEQEPLAPEYKTEQNLIDGCQSRVWLQADMEDGKVVFQAESDALIVKGIIALLIKVVSGHTPVVNRFNPTFIKNSPEKTSPLPDKEELAPGIKLISFTRYILSASSPCKRTGNVFSA